MSILIEYPLLAAGVGVAFLVAGRWAGCRTASGVGLLWVLYAAYETGMQQRWLCSGECNIRIDLLIIYPLLLAGSAIAVFSLFRMYRTQRRQADVGL